MANNEKETEGKSKRAQKSKTKMKCSPMRYTFMAQALIAMSRNVSQKAIEQSSSMPSKKVNKKQVVVSSVRAVSRNKQNCCDGPSPSSSEQHVFSYT